MCTNSVPPHKPEPLQICRARCRALIGPRSDWPALIGWLFAAGTVRPRTSLSRLRLKSGRSGGCWRRCGNRIQGFIPTDTSQESDANPWEPQITFWFPPFYSFPGPLTAPPRAVRVRTVSQKEHNLQLTCWTEPSSFLFLSRVYLDSLRSNRLCLLVEVVSNASRGLLLVFTFVNDSCFESRIKFSKLQRKCK